MPRIFGGKEARTAFKKGKPDLAAENTVCYLQVLALGTDCNDSAPSILLFFDRQRYLFNAGEGFQRFCVEHKIKMNRVSSCLVTRLTGDATGGLPGMCLTMADASSASPSNRPKLDIVGPVGLAALVNAMRSFISSNAVGINSLEFGGVSLPPPPPLINPQVGSGMARPQWHTADRPPAVPTLVQSSQAELAVPVAPRAAAADSSTSNKDGTNQPVVSQGRSLSNGTDAAGGVPGKVEQASGVGGVPPGSPEWEGLPVFPGAGAGLRAPRTTDITSGDILEPVVENDLVKITPVLLSSTLTPPTRDSLAATKQDGAGHLRGEGAGNRGPHQDLGPATANSDPIHNGGLLHQQIVSGSSQIAEDRSAVEQMDMDEVGRAEGGAQVSNVRTEQIAKNASLAIGPELSRVAVAGSLGAVANDPADCADADSLEQRASKRARMDTIATLDSSIGIATPGMKKGDSAGAQEGALAAANGCREGEAGAAGKVYAALPAQAPTRQPTAPPTLPPRQQGLNPTGLTPPRIPQSGVSPFNPPEYPSAACYICELTKVPGRFLPEVAMSLGVPRGIMFATLKSGKSVTLEDGRVIEAHQVNEPHHPGPVAVIADCPDASYLPSLLAAHEWERFYQPTTGNAVPEGSTPEQKAIDVVAHLARAEIVEHADYQSWLGHFGPETRHIFVNSRATNAAPIMTSSALIQARLNCLHPTIFPLHQFASQIDAKPASTEPSPDRDPRSESSRETSPVPVMVTSDSIKKEAVPVPERQRVPGSRRIRSQGCAAAEQGEQPPQQHTQPGGLPSQQAAKFGKTPSHEAVHIDDTHPLHAVQTGQASQPGQVNKAEHPQQAMQVGQAAPANSSGLENGVTTEAASHRRSRNAPRVKAFKLNEKHIAGQNLLKFHLRPPTRRGCFDDGDVPPPVDLAAVPGEMAQRIELMDALSSALQMGQAVNTGRGHSCECQVGTLEEGGSPLEEESRQDGNSAHGKHAGLVQRLGRDALEIVFLGTGAAIPSKYRNVTGIYLDFFRRGGMMMDCGEGSYGQLRRKYGKGADEMLKRLRCIWISHIHADHHAGLPRVLSRRRRLLGPDCPPLLVIGPRALHRALYAHGQCEPLAYHFIDCSVTVPRHPGPKEEKDKAIFAAAKESLGLTKIESITVDHCTNSYGGVLESADGWKLVFSGDTRPCMNVVQAAKNATVLIHEATFEDALEDEAIAKKHSLTCEAVEVGAKARVYRTILTHFSQRYPKIPVIDPSFQTSTCIASDLMTVNLADLPLLPWLVKPLGMLFREDPTEMEADEETAPEPAPKAELPQPTLPILPNVA